MEHTHIPGLSCVEQEGEWVDYATREAPAFQIPWLFISEPTGFIGQLQQNIYQEFKKILLSWKLLRVLSTNASCLWPWLSSKTPHNLSGPE